MIWSRLVKGMGSRLGRLRDSCLKVDMESEGKGLQQDRVVGSTGVYDSHGLGLYTMGIFCFEVYDGVTGHFFDGWCGRMDGRV